MGQALGIEGAEIPGRISPPSARAEARAHRRRRHGRLGLAGQSAFLDLLELEVDRGSGFHLARLRHHAQLPRHHPITVAAKWTYRAIFRVGDARVGQWSAPVSINVAP